LPPWQPPRVLRSCVAGKRKGSWSGEGSFCKEKWLGRGVFNKFLPNMHLVQRIEAAYSRSDGQNQSSPDGSSFTVHPGRCLAVQPPRVRSSRLCGRTSPPAPAPAVSAGPYAAARIQDPELKVYARGCAADPERLDVSTD